MRRSNKQYELTKHHIIPRSRGGLEGRLNIVLVPRKMHEDYHTLFNNRTPEEIVQYLNKDFWGNTYEIEIRRK